MAIELKSNVTHTGVNLLAGEIVDGIPADVEADLIERGLAVETDQPATKAFVESGVVNALTTTSADEPAASVADTDSDPAATTTAPPADTAGNAAAQTTVTPPVAPPVAPPQVQQSGVVQPPQQPTADQIARDIEGLA